MKYSLTIHDLSASQVTDLMNRVNGEATITSVIDPKVTSIVENTMAAAAQNVVAANTPATDLDAVMTASTNELLKSTKTGELDSAGMPWDERIHSGSKKTNADGKWKLRKNVDENLVKQVEAENRAAAPAGEIPAFLRTGVPAAAQSATVPATVPATSVVNATAPAVAPMPPAPAAVVKRDFSGLMLKISNLFATRQIAPDYPQTIVQRVNTGFQTNIATLTDIANDPRMVEYSWQCLEVDGKAA